MTEAQKRRTFELIGKYVGKKYNISLTFEPNIVPSANPQTKEIKLPINIKAENIFPALAELIHEAGHIRATTFDSKKIAQDKDEFNILNAIEDIRIDRENMSLLPNMKGIHEEVMKYSSKNRDESKISREAKVLINCIYRLEGFGQYKIMDSEIDKFIKDNDLEYKIEDLVFELNLIVNGIDKYKEARKNLLEIKEILKLANTPPQQEQKEGMGEEEKAKQACEKELDLGDIGTGNLSSDVFTDLDPHPVDVPSSIGTQALSEMTRRKFIELLKVKEAKQINCGIRLNTDKLISYFTGDIDELFISDIIKRELKSKIILVLDCSASMGRILMDGVPRNEALAKVVQGVIDLLNELQEIHSVNLNYEVRGFGQGYYRWNKDNWKQDYLKHDDACTLLSNAFIEAQNEILGDPTIDGKKLILLITDGEVFDNQIETIRKAILKHNEDVRCMLLGIGANPVGHFCDKITGHNILALEMADAIMLEAIMEAIQ